MQVADLPDTVNDATGLSPLNVYDNLLWMLAIGRDDLAAQRFVRFAAFEPGYMRYIAYDPTSIACIATPGYRSCCAR